MNKLSIVVLMLVSLFVASCGEKTPEKTELSDFTKLQNEGKSIESTIKETTNCDDLSLMHYSIDGLSSAIMNYGPDSTLTEAELEQLTVMVDELRATLNGRWSVLECEQITDSVELDTYGECDDEFYD